MLAGGRSTRFGNQNKLEAEYLGAPLWHHAVLRVAEVCREVVVVVSPGAIGPSGPAGVPIRVARDPAEGGGPLAGLRAGLATLGGDHLALVAGGDMPDLRVAVLREMLRVAGDKQIDAVALQEGGGFRPLPCAVRTAPTLERARALLDAGDRSLRGLLGTLRLAVVGESTWTALDPGRRTLFDVDEPADLDR